MTKPRGKEVEEILEVLGQEHFMHIAEQISHDNRISKLDQDTIRRCLGPATYNEFVVYIESHGEHFLDNE